LGGSIRSVVVTSGDAVEPSGSTRLKKSNVNLIPTSVTISTTAIQKANWNSPLMLTSRFSQPALASMGSFGLGECLVAMLMLQDALKPRIVKRRNGHFLQLRHIRPHPHAADTDERKNIQQVNLRPRLFKRRHNQPVDVHQRYDHHPCGQDGESFQATLDPSLQQDEERHKEMKHQQRGSNDGPAAEGAGHVPGDFLLQVAGPDDQELRK